MRALAVMSIVLQALRKRNACRQICISAIEMRQWSQALVVVALWTCYCSPRTFSDLALVFFYHFTSKLLLTNFLDWRCVADAQSISQQSNLRSDSVVSPLWCLNYFKWKGCKDSGCKYRSYWEMTFIWVQKAADGSVCKLSHYCTQSVQFHKPWKVREVSVMMSSSL